MSAPIEYRGLPALEYAAQTGAQLFRQRRPEETPQAIEAAIAHALWKFGAAHQVVCVGIDHRALAKTQPYPGWAPTIRRVGLRSARVAGRAARRLGAMAEQLALFARVARVRARHAQT